MQAAMFPLVYLLLAVFARTADAGPSCPAGQSGSPACAARGSALLQSKQTTRKGSVEDDEEESTNTSTNKEEKVGASGAPEWLEDRLADLQVDDERSTAETEDHWMRMDVLDTSLSDGPHALHKVLDANAGTWGGAVQFVADLGRVWIIKNTYINWRICKCWGKGTVKLVHSMDGNNWTTYHEPGNVFTEGKSIKKEYHEEFKARFVGVFPTEKASLKFVGFWDYKLFGHPDRRLTNVYGWYRSYRPLENGLAGTEMVHLIGYKGKLFGGTGYWMNKGRFRPAEVVRLDCPMCDWVVESQVNRWAGRTEILKAIQWTTDAAGDKLDQPVDKLIAGFYMNWQNEGRCFYNVRNDDHGTWWSDYYWRKRPYKNSYFSARALELFQDPVTGIDRLFFVTGMDGIISGTFDSTKPTFASFPRKTESGRVETRPLALVQMDQRLYFSASSYIKRRINGHNPKWEKVFDMADHDRHSRVDEAVGGIRGISRIYNPASPTGNSLLFAWAANARAKGCMIRLDPDGKGGYKHEQEQCTKDVMQRHLGRNRHGRKAMVTFVISGYNNVLEVNTSDYGLAHIIGFQSLLYAYSTFEYPIDMAQVGKAGRKRLAYYAGAGYMLRRGPKNYTVRVPGGPRYNPVHIYPKQTAVRSYSLSPFNDSAVYFGGYDCNHYPSYGSAWVQRGTAAAVYGEPVPCQKELGCGHRPGEKFKLRGCDWCQGGEFHPHAVAWFKKGKPVLCQGVIDFLNGPEGGDDWCKKALKWGSVEACCKKTCHLCDAMPNTTFKKDNIAGEMGGGENYTCKTAMRHQADSGTICSQAQAWWSGKCCEPNNNTDPDA